MLFSHLNVWNTCLLILLQKGYRLWLLGNPDERNFSTRCTWNAEKGGMKFRAANPLELLGLIAVRDHLNPVSDTPYWWRVEGPNIIEKLEAAWRKGIEYDRAPELIDGSHVEL